MNCDSVILVDLVSSDNTISSHIFGFTSESEEEEDFNICLALIVY